MTASDTNLSLLLHAALDGELDAAGMIDVENRMAAEPELTAQYARLRVLRNEISSRFSTEKAPPGLRMRIEALSPVVSIPAALPRRTRFQAWPLRQIAASLLIGFAFGTLSIALFAPQASDVLEQTMIDGYVRGRISGQYVDVATSDRHNVKPWLAARVPSATVVVDLEQAGFPLVGGRIDMIGRTPTPTLVYKRREHIINVFELPKGTSVEPLHARDGFAITAWTDADRRYAAISDLPRSELDSFVVAFRNGISEDGISK